MMAFTQKNISLLRAVALALVCVCLVLLFLPWLGQSERFDGVRITLGFNPFQTGLGGNYTSFWSVMLVILSILYIVCLGLTVFGLVTERNLTSLPQAVLGFLIFLLALFQLFFFNGDQYYESEKMKTLLPMWLFLLLNLLTFGAAVLDDIAAGRKPFDLSRVGIKLAPRAPRPTRAPQAPAGWQCPQCGTFQPAQQNFCDRCGARKPEPVCCPACGRPAQPGEMFCANCGTKI